MKYFFPTYTDRPTVSKRSLRYLFDAPQGSCPNVSVTIQIDNIEDVAPLTYELTVSSSAGCVLQKCPMVVSPGERVLTVTLLEGVDYTATLEASNDCGPSSTTVPIRPGK